MTAEEIRKAVEFCLQNIALTEPAHVHASRKGIVAGVQIRDGSLVLRRAEGRVRLEKWMAKKNQVKHYDLPDDLEKRAAKMLDNLA